MNNNDLKKYLKRRLSRVQGRFDYVKDYNPDKHTFHGGWEQGYAQGQLSLLEDILDLIEEDEYTYEMFQEDCHALRCRRYCFNDDKIIIGEINNETGN